MPGTINKFTLYIALVPTHLTWALTIYLRGYKTSTGLQNSILDVSCNPTLRLCISTLFGGPMLWSLLLLVQHTQNSKSVSFYTGSAASTVLRIIIISTLAVSAPNLAWNHPMSNRQLLIIATYCYCCMECILLVAWDMLDYYSVLFLMLRDS